MKNATTLVRFADFRNADSFTRSEPMSNAIQNRTRTVLTLAAVALILGLAGTTQAAPIIYESFSDLDPTLAGNTPGTGLTGTWAQGLSGGNSSVQPTSVSFGPLITSGGSFNINGTATTNRSYNVSTLTGAATPGSLENAGLLNDGATLWFSVLHSELHNVADDRASFALSEVTFTSNANFASAGDGIGFWISNGGQLQARVTNGTNNHVTGSGVDRFSLDDTILVVGEIIFGAGTDTVNLYLPDVSSLELGPVVSTASAPISQLNLDTVTFFKRIQTPETDTTWDEIRFGATFADVTPNTLPEPSSLTLLGLGLLSCGFVGRRRRQR